MQPIEHTAAVACHPLEPLSADEIEAAAALLRAERGLGASVQFVYITLMEPTKAVLRDHRDGAVVDRQAFVVLRDRDAGTVHEAVVSLSRRETRSWREVPGVQAPLTPDEISAYRDIVKNDPRWQEAMRQRGVTEFDRVRMDPWPVGYHGPQDAPEQGRFLHALTWVGNGEDGDNAYARPVDGLIVRFDLDRMQVVDVEDHGTVPLAPRSANYTAEGIKAADNVPTFPQGPRTDLRPVDIAQPEGPSFQVSRHEVRWQRWRLRVGFTPREGLVLHDVCYEDKGEVRPILHRASLSEMFVPYGDPSPMQFRKNVFDVGEFGLGILANSLELGCDCLGEIHYFDGFVNDNQGRAVRIPNAICMHEEDGGVLWKHTDLRSGHAEVRRSRRLVISMFTTVGNYDYGFFWYLYQDGTIEYEVKLTGIITNGSVPAGERPRFGTLVAPGVYGPNHQHIFCARLDMTVDGPHNSVVECDSVPVETGPDNPYGNAWEVSRTLLRRESEAQRPANTATARFWRIENSARRNAVGDPVAYRLEPGASTPPPQPSGTHALNRAQFATKNLWVTAYDPDELFAAGAYPNQHPGGAGLPEWVQADRPLEDTDLVVWHTFTAHHVVRPEDWPVMPVSTVGFMLRPDGFFDGNPALDVPASASHARSDQPSASGCCPAEAGH
ncbi:primary-amine oxidase [Catenulispora rubra]|uniref:primary-amine oxidase n=1 Tax=Catenulispora rubra TaxID=280293 RepID=UPI0018921D92|nr:primary-amine oxidase [Catenulispora rubra]